LHLQAHVNHLLARVNIISFPCSLLACCATLLGADISFLVRHLPKPFYPPGLDFPKQQWTRRYTRQIQEIWAWSKDVSLLFAAMARLGCKMINSTLCHFTFTRRTTASEKPPCLNTSLLHLNKLQEIRPLPTAQSYLKHGLACATAKTSARKWSIFPAFHSGSRHIEAESAKIYNHEDCSF